MAFGDWVADFFRIGLEPHWRQLVTFGWLYVGADAKNAFGGPWKGSTRTGIYRIAFGAPIVLGGALLSGLYPADSLMIVLPMLGAFVLYRVAYALRYAFERRQERQPYLADLRAKLGIAVLIAAAGSAVVAAGMLTQSSVPATLVAPWPLVTLYVLIALLVAYHMREGYRNATTTRRDN